MRADDPKYKWYVVVALFWAAGLNYADRAAISAVFPLLRSDLGASDLALGAVGSFFLWSYALGSPLAGYVSDRLSRSRLIIWSLLSWSVVTFFTGFAGNMVQLLALRVLLGITECFYLPAAIALIAEHHGRSTRGTAMSLHIAGLNFGLVAGGTLAGYVGEHFGWRTVFFLLGSVGLVSALLTWLVLRGGDAPEPVEDLGVSSASQLYSPWQSLVSLWRVSTYLILLSEAMIVSIGTWIFFNWLPLYFKDTFQMSLAGAGFSGTVLQIAASLGIIAGGHFSDRVARKSWGRRMLLQSVSYFAAAPFLLAFLGRPNLALLMVCILLFSFLRAVGQSNEQPILCDLLANRLRSTAVGLMNMANSLAGGVGIIIAGHLKQDFGLGGVFAGVSAIVAIAGLLVLTGYRFFFERDLLRTRQRHSGG